MEQAEAVTRAIRGPWIYARVDGIDRAGVFTVLELELIEPHLFLGFEPFAARRFADAVMAVVDRPAIAAAES